MNELLQGKRFGLVLSAGFFGFYGHAGFFKGLQSAGLNPSAYAGTSAGGMVGAYAAAGARTQDIEELVLSQTRQSFWDPDPIGALRNAVNHGFTGLLRGDRFRGLLERTLPVKNIEDCPTPLVLAATDLSQGASRIFTEGELAPRVHATCAYPGLFRAVKLEGALLWDGGLVDKAPVMALADSEAGKNLDAILVHYLPSRTREELSGAFAYAQGMAAAMAAGRRAHFQLQLKVLETRKVPVYVVVSNLPPVSPTSMERGFDALDQARRAAAVALSKPPVEFDG
ncbi:MAG: patatin-like phospholipase family protein [Myxococcaceae bacterium]